MALNVYDSCPGGMDCKIKFCACGKDMLGDLEKVIVALQGEQRAAALSLLQRLRESKGDRACVYTLTGMTQLETRDADGFLETADAFFKAFPDNVIAVGFAACAAAMRRDADTAVDQLQRAVELTGDTFHEVVVNAYVLVTRLLASLRKWQAAIAHGYIAASFFENEEDSPAEIVGQLCASPQIPLLMKPYPEFQEYPHDSPHKAENDEAVEMAVAGRWAAARERFQKLTEAVPDDPTFWRNLASVESCLAHDDRAAEAYRKLAGTDGVDSEDAIEAEAMAMLLDGATPDVSAVAIRRVFPISDVGRALERLQADPQSINITSNMARELPEGTPPPRGGFVILDRPRLDSAEGATADQLPISFGRALLFGKETDRDARLEFIGIKSPLFEAGAHRIQQLLEEFAGEPGEDTELEQQPFGTSGFLPMLELPGEIPEELADELRLRRFDSWLRNDWAERANVALGGSTPKEAAKSPDQQRRLLALMSLMELAVEQIDIAIDFGRLRLELGLPAWESGEEPIQEQSASLSRLHRLVVEELEDQALRESFNLAVSHRANRAAKKFAEEIVARESLSQIHEVACMVLFQNARTNEEAKQWNLKGRRAAIANDRSPAKWLLGQLPILLRQGEGEEFMKTVERLQADHMQEPGVAQQLYQIMSAIGALPGQPPPGAQPGTQPPPSPAGAATEEGIWTPDQAAEESGGQEKPKLWLPGMD